jgi:hypothetical protein
VLHHQDLVMGLEIVAEALELFPRNLGKVKGAQRLKRAGHLPMQKVEKMRLRMSSAVVAPVMASMGRRAA